MSEGIFSQNMSMKLNGKDFFGFFSIFFISHSSASPCMCKFSYAAGSDLGWGIRELTQANCQELKYKCFQKQKKNIPTNNSGLHYQKQCSEEQI